MAKTTGKSKEPDFDDAKNLVAKYSAIFGVPSSVVLSILSVESGFRRGVSNTSERAMKRGGAWGISQMTLETANDLTRRYPELARKYWPHFDGTSGTLIDLETNVALATFYLSLAWKRFKDFYATTLSYHQGVGTVARLLTDPRPWSEKLPPFGRQYYSMLTQVHDRFSAYA